MGQIVGSDAEEGDAAKRIEMKARQTGQAGQMVKNGNRKAFMLSHCSMERRR